MTFEMKALLFIVFAFRHAEYVQQIAYVCSDFLQQLSISWLPFCFLKTLANIMAYHIQLTHNILDVHIACRNQLPYLLDHRFRIDRIAQRRVNVLLKLSELLQQLHFSVASSRKTLKIKKFKTAMQKFF